MKILRYGLLALVAVAGCGLSAAQEPRTTAAQLQQLIRDGKVAELRTVYNDTYGASLLFKADELSFYVTLFQGKNFWRVFKTAEEKQAQETYRVFAAQSEELAAADIRKIILQAQSTRDGQKLADQNAQLTRLQADQALRVQQDAEIARQQQQAGQDVQALAQQQRDAEQQLKALRQQIEALEAQQAQIGQSKPAAASAANAPPNSTTSTPPAAPRARPVR